MAKTDSIVPRRSLDFDLDGDIPRHWWGGDPFASRWFDALSTVFPEGERYFVRTVRQYAQQIDDPALRAAVEAFSVQEGQHSAVHRQYNERLRDQGVDVERVEARSRRFHALLSRLPQAWQLAHTAAAEHLTAVFGKTGLDSDAFAAADERIRALYLWHGTEEVEHKAVAFDVLTRVARVAYLVRALAFVQVLVMMPLNSAVTVEHMLRVDGFSRAQRMRIWARGLMRLLGPRGSLWPVMPLVLAYFRPGFHPWQDEAPAAFERWRDEFARSGDPFAAAQVVGSRSAREPAAAMA
jgi:predicted metal-dependent hydrolase